MIAVMVALVAIDLATKSIAFANSGLPGVDPVANDRLMLGLSGLDARAALVVSTIVIGFGAVAAFRLIRAGFVGWWLLPVGLAGFAGNAIDRLTLGHVRDWIIVGPMRWNLADIFLLVAIVVCITGGIRAIDTDHREKVAT